MARLSPHARGRPVVPVLSARVLAALSDRRLARHNLQVIDCSEYLVSEVSVAEGPEWTILEYTTDTGCLSRPGLPQRPDGANRDEALALLGRLRQAGAALRRPTSGTLGEGLFELRGHEVRIFYIFLPGRRAVLLDGMLKKQDAIPPGVLKRVRRYHRQVRAMMEDQG